MKNPITELMGNFTDAELVSFIDDIDYCKEFGYYPEECSIRELARKLAPYTMYGTVDMVLTEITVGSECANRFKTRWVMDNV